MATVELRRPPGLAALYARAVLGTPPVLRARPRPAGLPDTAVALRGVPVDRAHLAAYDRVCGFRLTDALPATYPHVLAFPLALWLLSAPDFPFPAPGLVHVANRSTLHRPVDAGERLDLAVRADGLRAHGRGRQFDVVATATVGGAEVWRGVSTYLHREGAPGGGARDDADRPAPPAAAGTWRVPAGVGTAYAAVSGDRNPIHTSRLGARAFGFRRPIAHGMWTTARCLAALAGRLPDAHTVEVSFQAPVPLPATVAFAAWGDWDFALHDPRSGKPHLTGSVRPAGS
ncbi:MAG TPA: MaoC/PaaZ C-terminal domain-containing protein [Pilimelia sp.]|nr:MaoC/PaaZ C-terminal domain-containing protein [Pilimelia sp.]